MNIARRAARVRELIVALALSVPMLPAIAQAITYRVTIDTITLAAQSSPPAPFSLEFQLIGGDPGTPNTVVISNFDFGSGGRPRGTPTLTGGATGDLSSAVVLTDGQFLNEFVQEFTPSARDPLTFTVDLTDEFVGPIPDSFSIGILDRSGFGLPTEFFDAFVQIDIKTSPEKKSFASDSATAPPSCPDCPPVNIAAPAVTAGAEVCPVDVTHQVAVTLGPVRSAGVSGRFIQQVRITNQSSVTIEGAKLALDHLPGGAKAIRPDGVTTCALPAGSPFFNVNPGRLRPNQTGIVNLQFTSESSQSITYTPRALADTTQ